MLTEEIMPIENYPLPGLFERFTYDPLLKDRLEKEGKEKEVNEYLKKDFYYRNITEKKKLLADGIETDFVDDGVLKYVIQDPMNDPNIDDWLD
jgi:hypothetical protein